MPLKSRKKPGDDRIKLIKGWTANPEIVLGILDKHERAKKAKRMKEWRASKKDKLDVIAAGEGDPAIIAKQTLEAIDNDR